MEYEIIKRITKNEKLILSVTKILIICSKSKKNYFVRKNSTFQPFDPPDDLHRPTLEMPKTEVSLHLFEKTSDFLLF